MSLVLGIETSCDETGIAVVEDGRRVLASEVATQIDFHKEFGGVVPEIASRQHTKIISQVTAKCLRDAGVTPDALDAIAVTVGPGLLGSLFVGVGFANALGYVWGKPVVPVHHIEGHIYSAFLAEEAPALPFLALIVSGGHSQLIECGEAHRYEILGTTRDDAVGESFDKVARLLGLSYPGGPSIQRAAEGGDPKAFKFPRGLKGSDSLDFSFSGLKTAVLYALREHPEPNIADFAASFQEAAVDALIQKTLQAIDRTGAERLVVAGGVAANRRLRERLTRDIPVPVFVPPFAYCIDNGAMIAAAGAARLRNGKADRHSLSPSASLAL